VEPIMSKSVDGHFITMSKKNYVKHDLKISALDFIPYP
jgi:hypothetical protein